MRFITPLADRMINLVVPKVDAAAGIRCPPGYVAACGSCDQIHGNPPIYRQLVKNCSYNGSRCTLTCGACYQLGACL
jgi:hypothetical protein